MTDSRRESQVFNWFLVILAGLLTGFLWQHPVGRKVLWPFTLLATWIHEMGHATAAMLLADFEVLRLNPDGSGAAMFYKSPNASLSNATIAATGLLGPAIAGSLLILFGRTMKGARVVLFILATALFASALFCVSWTDFFSMLVIIAWGACLMTLALYATDIINFFAVQLLGIQFCLNSYKDIDYMLSPGFTDTVTGKLQRSDSGAIAYELGFLPYWFWGGLTAVLSILLLLSSLYFVFTSSLKEDAARPIQ